MNSTVRLLNFMKNSRRLRGSQSGFTMIELMVAMAIGLVILAAMSSVVVTNIKARSEFDKSNRMIENGRYALTVLADSIRMAGYLGPFDTNNLPVIPAHPLDPPDPCDFSSIAKVEAALGYYVQGFRALTTATLPGLPPECLGTGKPLSTADLRPGSDVIVVKRVSSISTPAASVPSPNAVYYFQSSLCDADASRYRIDTVKANFILRTAKWGDPANKCASNTELADTYRIVVEIYFVAPDNQPGDGVPTLKRMEIDDSGAWIVRPLVEGIEYLKLEYGIDNSPTPVPDGVVDRYLTCEPPLAPATPPPSACSAEQLSQVVDVRVHLLARNLAETSGFTDDDAYRLSGSDMPVAFDVAAVSDHYKRQAFHQTIKIMNANRRAGL